MKTTTKIFCFVLVACCALRSTGQTNIVAPPGWQFTGSAAGLTNTGSTIGSIATPYSLVNSNQAAAIAAAYGGGSGNANTNGSAQVWTAAQYLTNINNVIYGQIWDQYGQFPVSTNEATYVALAAGTNAIGQAATNYVNISTNGFVTATITNQSVQALAANVTTLNSSIQSATNLNWQATTNWVAAATNSPQFNSDAIQLHTNLSFTYHGTNYYFPNSRTACLQEIDTNFPPANGPQPWGLHIRLDDNAAYPISQPVTLTNQYFIEGGGNWSSGFVWVGPTTNTVYQVMAAAVQVNQYNVPTNTSACSMIAFVGHIPPGGTPAYQGNPNIFLRNLYFQSSVNFPIILTSINSINLYADDVAWYGPDAITSAVGNYATIYPIPLASMSFTQPKIVAALTYVNTIEEFTHCTIYECADGIMTTLNANPWLRVWDMNAEDMGQDVNANGIVAYPATNLLSVGFSFYVGPNTYSAAFKDWNGYQNNAEIWVDEAGNSGGNGVVIDNAAGGQASVHGMLISTNANGAYVSYTHMSSMPVTTVASAYGVPGGSYGVGSSGALATKVASPWFTMTWPSDQISTKALSFGFTNNLNMFNFCAGPAFNSTLDAVSFGGDGSARLAHNTFVLDSSGNLTTASAITVNNGSVISGNGSGLTNLTAASLTGTVPLGVENPSVVTNGYAGTATGTNLSLTGNLSAGGNVVVVNGQFTGNGAGLTNIPPTGISAITTNMLTLMSLVDFKNGLINNAGFVATNASFTFTGPTNVNAASPNGQVIMVINTGGGTINISVPASVNVLGTANCTNRTAVTFYCDQVGGGITNAIFTPLK